MKTNFTGYSAFSSRTFRCMFVVPLQDLNKRTTKYYNNSFQTAWSSYMY